MLRFLLSLLAGVVGAVVGAGLLSTSLAMIFTALYGGFEGQAAMGGVSVGLPFGGLIGFSVGFWLVWRLRRWWAVTG